MRHRPRLTFSARRYYRQKKVPYKKGPGWLQELLDELRSRYPVLPSAWIWLASIFSSGRTLWTRLQSFAKFVQWGATIVKIIKAVLTLIR